MAEIVYSRSGPPLPFGSIDWPVPRAFVLYTGVDPINLGAYEGQGYLLSLAAFDPSLSLDIPSPPMPFGCIDRNRAHYFSSQGRVATIYPAATGNAARSSDIADTPASTWVAGRMGGAFNYAITLFGGADPTTAGSATVGVLQLDDPEGELDGLAALGWDNAPLAILRGDPAAAFNTWSVVANLTTAGLLYDLRKKEIKLRDLAWQLTQAELHGLRYTGLGGMDGDLTLKGVVRPYCVGQVFNVTPLQINAVPLIYQVSCSSVLAVDSVSDGAAALTPGADYPTWAALNAATVPPSTFATCLALGLIRLGSKPLFIVTANVRGDNDTINGLGYPSTRAQIARRIATGRGTLRLTDPGQIDLAAYRTLEQMQPATIGYYWDQAISKAAALNECMAGCLGWWFMRLNGLFAAGQLDDPASASPAFQLSYPASGSDAEFRLGEPSMTDFQPPRRATLMGWSRNYTPMQLTQIAGSVSLLNSAIYQSPTRFTTSNDPWVAAAYPSAAAVSIDGGFAYQGDAQVEGDRQQRLLRIRREAFDVPIVFDPFADVVARVVEIANGNRLGMGAAKRVFVYGFAVNGNSMPVLKVWG